MEFISDLTDLFKNVYTLEKYLGSSNPVEREFAKDIVRRGKTILVYRVKGTNHFAPSRFLGYKSNNITSHISNEEKDGRDTNPIITSIIGNRPFFTDDMENDFKKYVISLGAIVQNNKRNYWRIRGEDGKIWSMEKMSSLLR
jgi:5-methylcytosine-specific restriction protein A